MFLLCPQRHLDTHQKGKNSNQKKKEIIILFFLLSVMDIAGYIRQIKLSYLTLKIFLKCYVVFCKFSLLIFTAQNNICLINICWLNKHGKYIAEIKINPHILYPVATKYSQGFFFFISLHFQEQFSYAFKISLYSCTQMHMTKHINYDSNFLYSGRKNGCNGHNILFNTWSLL